MTHIQLSNPGNSRNQVGRMLASDSRFVAFANGNFNVLFLIRHLFKLKSLVSFLRLISYSCILSFIGFG